MVQSISGGNPIFSSDGNHAPAPLPAGLCTAVGDIWSAFALISQTNNINASMAASEQFFSLFSTAVNNFSSYVQSVGVGNLDSLTAAIYNELNTSLPTGGTIFSICNDASSDPKGAFVSWQAAIDIDTPSNSLQNVLYGADQSVNSWYSSNEVNYPNTPSSYQPPTNPPANIQSLWTNFIQMMGQLEQYYNGGDYNSNYCQQLGLVCNQINSIETALAGTSPLDAYGALLQNFLEAPLDISGDTLVSLAASVSNNANQSNPAVWDLTGLLFNNSTGPNLYGIITSQVNEVVKWEWTQPTERTKTSSWE